MKDIERITSSVSAGPSTSTAIEDESGPTAEALQQLMIAHLASLPANPTRAAARVFMACQVRLLGTQQGSANCTVCSTM